MIIYWAEITAQKLIQELKNDFHHQKYQNISFLQFPNNTQYSIGVALVKGNFLCYKNNGWGVLAWWYCFKAPLSRLLYVTVMDRFSIGWEFPVHFLKKGKVTTDQYFLSVELTHTQLWFVVVLIFMGIHVLF